MAGRGREVDLWIQTLTGDDIVFQPFREELFELMDRYGINQIKALAKFSRWTESDTTNPAGNVVIHCYTHLPECQPVPEILGGQHGNSNS